MKKVYIDANVLIAAFQGEEQVAQKALRVLDEPGLKLVISDYLLQALDFKFISLLML